jgi:CrcB protein|tara:strand:- start:68 stop:445 length:378 start_codon:yes stop_codon:yes gene_type:complete
MNILLIIFLGGGTGATLRYLISELVNKLIPTSIGYGTISVNLIGAFLMGALFYFISSKLLINEQVKIFLTIGFLGGFTTFSSFNLDFYNLIEASNYLQAIIYLSISVIGSIILFFVGLNLVKFLF